MNQGNILIQSIIILGESSFYLGITTMRLLLVMLWAAGSRIKTRSFLEEFESQGVFIRDWEHMINFLIFIIQSFDYVFLSES